MLPNGTYSCLPWTNCTSLGLQELFSPTSYYDTECGPALPSCPAFHASESACSLTDGTPAAGLNDSPFVDANTYSTYSNLALDDGTQLFVTRTFGNIAAPPYYPRLQVYNITPGYEEALYSIGPIASDFRRTNDQSYGAYLSIDGRLLLVGSERAFVEAPDARPREGAVFLYRLGHDEATRLATIRKPAEAADTEIFGRNPLLLANMEGTEASMTIQGGDMIYSFYWNSTAGIELRDSVRSWFDPVGYYGYALDVDRSNRLIAVTMV
jgi:hypothetical protein